MRHVRNLLPMFCPVFLVADLCQEENPDPENTQLPWNHVSPGSGREGRVLSGEQSGVGEAVIVGLAEDDVVEHADAEDFRCFDQAACALAVFSRGSWVSGRVVMHEHDRSRAVQQCCLETFPWMNNRGGQASNAYRVIADGSVLGINGYQEEMLAVERREFLPKAVEKLAGVLEFRIFREGILRFLHKHDPVSGKHVLEFLHGQKLR